MTHYPVPIHLQPAYRGRFTSLGDLRTTELAAQEIINLPMYPEMTQDQILLVVDALRDCEGVIED